MSFGKYRGLPLARMLDDRAYMAWVKEQAFWPDKWEAKVLEAMRANEPMPLPPKKRPILEYEYEPGEIVTKVRRVVHREFAEEPVALRCLSCDNDSLDEIEEHDKYRCRACGSHVQVWFEYSTDGRLTVRRQSFTCPQAATSEAEYAEACIACPEKRGGIFGDHTSCGCVDRFRCQCV